MPTFKTTKELDKYIKNCMSIALRNTADILTDKLIEFIDIDFYQKYDPVQYSRTDQLKDSPKFKMLSNSIVEIFIDTDSMNYKSATGDYVAMLASRGFHGNEYIFREGYFWEDFLKYCFANTIHIYKSELRKLGLKVS